MGAGEGESMGTGEGERMGEGERSTREYETRCLLENSGEGRGGGTEKGFGGGWKRLSNQAFSSGSYSTETDEIGGRGST